MAELKVLPTPKAVQHKDVIRDAEEILRAAKAGEIDGIICVMTEPNSDFRVIYTGGMGLLRQLGALRMAEHDITHAAEPVLITPFPPDGP